MYPSVLRRLLLLGVHVCKPACRAKRKIATRNWFCTLTVNKSWKRPVARVTPTSNYFQWVHFSETVIPSHCDRISLFFFFPQHCEESSEFEKLFVKEKPPYYKRIQTRSLAFFLEIIYDFSSGKKAQAQGFCKSASPILTLLTFSQRSNKEIKQQR